MHFQAASQIIFELVHYDFVVETTSEICACFYLPVFGTTTLTLCQCPPRGQSDTYTIQLLDPNPHPVRLLILSQDSVTVFMSTMITSRTKLLCYIPSSPIILLITEVIIIYS